MHAIYRLCVWDYAKYRDHLLALDSESRYMRFGFSIKDETIEELCNKWRSKASQHVVFAIENDNLEVVAVAHISLEEAVPELAFSVLKEYQRQGMGDALMKRAIEYCQNRGIEHCYMVCLSSNNKMRQLARKNSAVIETEEGDSVGRVKIPSPTWNSIWHEYMVTSLGAIAHYENLKRNFFKHCNSA